MDRERAIRLQLASKVQPQKLTGPESKALAVVLIEVASAVVAGIDTQCKRANGYFDGALG
jgi:hypothetical protein